MLSSPHLELQSLLLSDPYMVLGVLEYVGDERVTGVETPGVQLPRVALHPRRAFGKAASFECNREGASLDPLYPRAGAMVQQLGALASLAKDLHLIP